MHQTTAPWTDNLSQTGQTKCSPWNEELGNIVGSVIDEWMNSDGNDFILYMKSHIKWIHIIDADNM